MNLLEKFFSFLGGANLSILKDLPSEKNKFIAVGIGVFNTALLSVFTMGYAIRAVINSTIDSPFIYILFSLFWGGVILGIDWGLITTMRKRSSYTARQTVEILFATLFRLSVAVIISFTVSKPLEVMVMRDFLPLARRDAQLNFERELNANEVHKVNNANEKVQNQDSIILHWQNEGENDLKANDYTLINLYDDKKLLENKISVFEKVKNSEDKISNQRIEESQNYINQFQKQLNQRRTRLSSINSQIIDVEKQIEFTNPADHLLLAKVKALHNEKQTINNEIQTIYSDQRKYIAIRDAEYRNIKDRSNRLAKLNQQLSNINTHISSRNAIIETQTQNILDSLQIAKHKFEVNLDTIQKKAEIEFNKNKKATDVFDKDNLINNLIAIGYLQRWINDSNSNQGKIEISKKVKQVSILLMVILIIVDIAPIVIKLMMPFGPYDQIKENLDKTKQVENISKFTAFKKNYPEIADLEAKEKFFKKELEIIKSSYQEATKYNNLLWDIHTSGREKIESEMTKTKDETERNILGELKTKSWGMFKKAFDNIFDTLNMHLQNIKK